MVRKPCLLRLVLVMAAKALELVMAAETLELVIAAETLLGIAAETMMVWILQNIDFLAWTWRKRFAGIDLGNLEHWMHSGTHKEVDHSNQSG